MSFLNHIEPYYLYDEPLYNIHGDRLPGNLLMYSGDDNRRQYVGSNLNVRTFTDKFISNVIQPAEVYEYFNRVFSEVSFSGTKHHGSCLVQGKIGHASLLGEDHSLWISMYTGCNHVYKRLIMLRLKRTFCMNEMPGILSSKGYFFSEKHDKVLHDESKQEDAFMPIIKLLDELPQHLRNYEAMRQTRLDTPYGLAAFQKHMREYYDPKQQWNDERVVRLNTSLSKAFTERTNANLPVSVERATQAITWLSSHGHSISGGRSTTPRTVEGGLKRNEDVVSVLRFIDKRTGVAA